MDPEDQEPMEDSTESTRSQTAHWTQQGRQSITNYYVNEIMTRLVEHPYASVPDLFQYMQMGGPYMGEEELLDLFGGRDMLVRTCRRMNIIRRAVLNGELGNLPVDLGNWRGGEPRGTGRERNEYIDWWTPHLEGGDVFWYTMEGMENEIIRYPSWPDTDHFPGMPAEEQMEETESESTSHGWIQMLMPQDWYWEADPEANLPDDEEMNESEDDDAEMN